LLLLLAGLILKLVCIRQGLEHEVIIAITCFFAQFVLMLLGVAGFHGILSNLISALHVLLAREHAENLSETAARVRTRIVADFVAELSMLNSLLS
jgi:arginine exporter protein ArgO